MTRVRLRESRVLLRAGEPSGAYYLAGYALECALKACIARQTRRHDFPQLDLARGAYTHDPTVLVRVAGLERSLRAAQRDPSFWVNWNIARDWTVDSRYEVHGSEEARDLLSAITAPRHGVLSWVRQHW